MGKYTALTDPMVDQKIESHFLAIVEAVRSRLEPEAIILRGSFGRGEGSVLVDGEDMLFLSDYEIDVITPSPFNRAAFRELSQKLTGDLGVQTGLRWARPDFLTRERFGPFTVGNAAPTISLYEIRYGSRTLYGEDFFARGPEIKTADIQLDNGMFLLLNRMAESMLYMFPADGSVNTDLESYYWVNKTVLACAEVLLLIWGHYHFSYAERGRSFAALAPEKLKFMTDQGAALAGMVARATEFKLRPQQDLYPDTVLDTWRTVIPEVDQVFRYVIEEILDFPTVSYENFPAMYLRQTYIQSKNDAVSWRISRKMMDLYRCLRNRTVPKAWFSRHYLYQVVYSIVPLVFSAQLTDKDADTLRLARKWMSMLGKLDPPNPNQIAEKEYLTDRLIWHWKVFCHG